MAFSASSERNDIALIVNRSRSVAHLFVERVAETPTAEAFRFPRETAWESVTWEQADARVRHIAAGLVALGIEPEQRVALASSTRYEWALADLAVMLAGAATTTIYPSTSDSDVAFIVSDSQSRLVFAEDDVQIAKLRANRSQLPEVVKVITFDGTCDGDWVISLGELEEMGGKYLAQMPTVVDDRIAAIEPQHLATLIYTSGTTGRPKGVRLTHDAWTYEAAAIDAMGLVTKDDLQFLWLPLSHVFGKCLLTLPLQVGFPTVVDGRVDRITDNLALVQPTFMGAAPRIFEKAYGRIATTISAEGGAKAKLFDWALSVGHRVAVLRAAGGQASGRLAAQHAIADRLVLHKIRSRFGGRIRFFVSGSAALNSDVAQWFDAVGLLILEGYGLTESCAASFLNRPQAYAFGSVGLAMPGTEVNISGDGEIMLRSPGIMAGYHNIPEATAESLDHEGWLHTGDIGNLDESGFLRITDRKKDVFKTSGGKSVAPSAIESIFKGVCPYASQLVVHGDGRRFVSALVTLDPDSITAWASQNALGGRSYADIATSMAARQMIQGYIDELNAQLNHWERIKKFLILPRDLSIEEGDLTPGTKLRRRVVTDKYQTDLDSLYS